MRKIIVSLSLAVCLIAQGVINPALIATAAPSTEIAFPTQYVDFENPSEEKTIGSAVNSKNELITVSTSTTKTITEVNALKTSNDTQLTDLLIQKTNLQTGQLLFSTLLGGSSVEHDPKFILDHNEDIIIAGTTESFDFPAQNALDQQLNGQSDLFVVKIDTNTYQILFSTLLGGKGNEELTALSIDKDNNIVLAGNTDSLDFPTQNAFLNTRSGNKDGFLTVLDANAKEIKYSTYFGGSEKDEETISSVYQDSKGGWLIAGHTDADDLPTTKAHQKSLNKGTDYFLTHFSPDGQKIILCTYLGGSGDERSPHAIVDEKNNYSVTGATASSDFPVSHKQFLYLGGASDITYTRLNSGGRMVFSEFLGGQDRDWPIDIQSNDQHILIIGNTGSRSLTKASLSESQAKQAGYLVGINSNNQLSFASRFDSIESLEISSAVLRGDTFIVSGFTKDNNVPFTKLPLQKRVGTAGFAAPFPIPSSIEATQPPLPIFNLSVEPGNGEVFLRWDNTDPLGSSTTDYVVSYSSDNFRSERKVFPEKISIENWTTVTGLENNKLYWFRVAAVNSYGESNWSNTVFTTPKEILLPEKPILGRTLNELPPLVTAMRADDGSTNITRVMQAGTQEIEARASGILTARFFLNFQEKDEPTLKNLILQTSIADHQALVHEPGNQLKELTLFVPKSPLHDLLEICLRKTTLGCSEKDNNRLTYDRLGNNVGSQGSSNIQVKVEEPFWIVTGLERGASAESRNSGKPLQYKLEELQLLGGSEDDTLIDSEVDLEGSIYLLMTTRSPDLTTKDAFQEKLAGGSDLYLSKWSSDGKTLIYATYLGGSSDDEASALYVDTNKNAIILGASTSEDFPTLRPFQDKLGGEQDMTLTKMSTRGNELIFSTYLGASGTEKGNDISLDQAGNISIIGETNSSEGLPLRFGLQENYGGGDLDGYFVKLNSAGAGLIYGSYIGGTSTDTLKKLIEKNDTWIIASETSSSDFPQLEQDQIQNQDIVILSIDIQEKKLHLDKSRIIGGSDKEWISDLSNDSSGNLWIAGTTSSSDFPTLNAFQDQLNGSSDSFVVQLQSNLSTIRSSFWGGSSEDEGLGILNDNLGNSTLFGSTSSDDFPSYLGIQTNGNGKPAAFLSQWNTLQQLQFSSYLSGNGSESIHHLHLYKGTYYAIGQTNSTEKLPFPSSSSQRAAQKNDVFIAAMTYSLFSGDSVPLPPKVQVLTTTKDQDVSTPTAQPVRQRRERTLRTNTSTESEKTTGTVSPQTTPEPSPVQNITSTINSCSANVAQFQAQNAQAISNSRSPEESQRYNFLEGLLQPLANEQAKKLLQINADTSWFAKTKPIMHIMMSLISPDQSFEESFNTILNVTGKPALMEESITLREASRLLLRIRGKEIPAGNLTLINVGREAGIFSREDDYYYRNFDAPLRRITALVLISRAINPGFESQLDASQTSSDLFVDMESGAWYIPYIEYGVRQNCLIKGYPDGSFRPNDSINYAEFAIMLERAGL